MVSLTDGSILGGLEDVNEATLSVRDLFVFPNPANAQSIKGSYLYKNSPGESTSTSKSTTTQ